MVHDRANWRMRARRAAVALMLGGFAVCCVSMDRPFTRKASCARPASTSGRAIPTINPTVAPRVNPNIAGTAVTTVGRTTPRIDATAVMRTTPRISTMTARSASRIGVRSLPYVRYSPNLYPACSYAYRDSDGACLRSAGDLGRSRRRSGRRARRPRMARAATDRRPWRSARARSRTKSWPRSTAR